MVRGSSFDPIVADAKIDVISVARNPETVEYVCCLRDSNLAEPVTFAFTVDVEQRRVLRVEKRCELVVSDLVTDVKANVWTVLGNDEGELCYGLQVDDPQLGQRIEFDLDVKADGTLDFSHLGFDNPPME